ncbi:MAG: vanadium-dependent haloperoxidase [Gemmobacter sp.]
MIRAALLLILTLASPAHATLDPEQAIEGWYRLTLELVRHTATYTPPVASRAFAYTGVAAWEALASGDPGLISLAGQLNGLPPLPPRDPGPYDEGTILNAALSAVIAQMFANTGPTGQRAMAAMDRTLTARAADGLPPEVAARSAAHGRAIAAHILAWAETDGGATVPNMGFPETWRPVTSPAQWVPTNAIPLQQTPLLPGWGTNRPFRMADGAACLVPPHPPYSEDPGSAFWAEAKEVHDTWKTLTAEQEAIALFWADDAMLSPTPPGHWISIAMQVTARDGADAARRAEVLALLGVTLADAFIACWHEKYVYDLVRPVTYIRRVIDPAFDTILITPPFPEYPSGHSVQSGAAGAILTHLFGAPFPFTDDTHADEGLPARHFDSFDHAAAEGGISRLYGGIHYRSAIEHGLAQGRCVGAHFTTIRTRR